MQDLIVMLVMHSQSTGDLAVENTFKPDFTREDGQHKSTWDEVLTDDLDTLKKK